jgi:hypothetical protein
MRRLTDDCGIIQHARFWFPDYKTGYCVDDNSRALLVASWYHQTFGTAEAHELMLRYLAFIHYVQRTDGQVCNFIDYSRRYLEQVGSPDSLGRTIWALGHMASVEERYLAVPAREMFLHAVAQVSETFAPHSLAYSLLGICAYGTCEANRHEARALARPLVTALLGHHHAARGADWEWFMPIVTYGNGRLPEALIRAGALLEDRHARDAGFRTLAFLNQVSYCENCLSVVGCHGWYPQDGVSAQFDQQPIDAGGMVEANLAAYELSHETDYFTRAVHAMDWFYGRNILGLSVYNKASCGCYDGLHSSGVNENQGAESTLVHLLAQLRMYRVAPELFAAEKMPETSWIAEGMGEHR